jgi:dsDNA-specific endonuclease/ATPase MutS2
MHDTDAKRLALSLRADLAEIDLHGFYPDEAVGKLDVFLYDQISAGCDGVKIIYGAGTGRLKSAALDYLHDHPLIDILIDEGGYAVALLHA